MILIPLNAHWSGILWTCYDNVCLFCVHFGIIHNSVHIRILKLKRIVKLGSHILYVTIRKLAKTELMRNPSPPDETKGS